MIQITGLTFICLHVALHQVHAVIHKFMDPVELRHIFGVEDHNEVPKYSLHFPTKAFHENEGFKYQVKFNDQLYRFHLDPVDGLLSDEGFHAVERIADNVTSLNLKNTKHYRHCLYTGHALSHNSTFIAVSGCGQKIRGLIQTNEGDYIFIQPIPISVVSKLSLNDQESLYSNDGSHDKIAHIIHKRDTYEFVHDSEILERVKPQTCLFNEHDDPYPEANVQRDDSSHLAVVKGPFIIELGVFADDEMWRHFKGLYGDEAADAELLNFVLASVNNIHLLYTHSTIDPKLDLTITRYEVLKNPPEEMSRQKHLRGDVDLLLQQFCEYQNRLNPASDADARHWDHGLLFSGYDLYRGRLKSVAGYAPVKGMCSGIRSCTINEGLDFGAVFVITHEMGHSLGMYHDGRNGCGVGCCIMSPSVGAGKTEWSSCSNQEYNEFIGKLGVSPTMPDNCLLDDSSRDRTRKSSLAHRSDGQLPGQKYTIDQQCRIFHGDCWRHEIRDGTDLDSVCRMVWCGEGEGIIRTTHPALEGSYCGENSWCIEGTCKKFPRFGPIAIDGQWSSWNDSPNNQCGAGECTTCTIDKQIRTRRSMRLCEDPAPNNGGKSCKGSMFRALVCNEEICTGVSASEYANQTCSKLRNDPSAPDLLLKGTGLQYTATPCKVWCHLETKNFIRAVSNFPDGTPCGANRYCVKGECLALACGGKSVVMDTRNDCVAKSGNWATWADWDTCSKQCGRGMQSRSRVCSTGKICLGISRQNRYCNTQKCVSTAQSRSWNKWGTWTDCDMSCSGGVQMRFRNCTGQSCDEGSPFEFRKCNLNPCPDQEQWSTWAAWTLCSVTCDGGIQIRRRKCEAAVCLGRSIHTQQCNRRTCPSGRIGNSGDWTDWFGWGQCSVTCGTGLHSRRRSCLPLGSKCDGERQQAERCFAGDCVTAARSISGDSGWSQWSNWGSCSGTCGTGSRFRRRVCSEKQCSGPAIEFSNCETRKCPALPERRTTKNHFDVPTTTQVNPRMGNWATWGSWSSCSHTCGTGLKRRFRTCNSSNGTFLPCSGTSTETIKCVQPTCPSDSGSIRRRFRGRGRTLVERNANPQPKTTRSSTWLSWSHWSVCSCSNFSQARFRTCLAVEGKPCNGVSLRYGKWTHWTTWSQCTRSCNRGYTVRNRKCMSSAKRCLGSTQQLNYCNEHPC